MVKLSELKKQSSQKRSPITLDRAVSLHKVNGREPLSETTSRLKKLDDRGFLGNVKFFLGEGVLKPIARGVESIPAGFESILQVGLENAKNIARNKLADDGAVFGISKEQFESRTPEQEERIRKNTRFLESVDRSIDTSKRLQSKWIEATQTGIEAPSDEFLKQSPIPFTENFSFTRMIALGTESVPMLGLAAAVTAATKSPIAGAAVIGTMEASQEFSEAKDKTNLGTANLTFIADTLMLSALESVPLTSFMKGGSLPVRAFRTASQEGVEEVLQSLWRDSVAKIGYDDTRVLTEGLLESFIGGFISGGVIGSLGSTNNIQVKVDRAKNKGVDVDKMSEAIAEQVIDSADDITEEFINKTSSEVKVDEEVKTEEDINLEDAYKKNSDLKNKNHIIDVVKKSSAEGIDGAARVADETFGVISTRLSNVDERLRDSIRKFEYSTLMAIKNDLDKVKSFIEGVPEKMGKKSDDFYTFDLALKNRDITTIDRLVKEYGLDEEYNNVRELLNEIPNRVKEVGIKMGFVENYFPRSVKDVDGLMKELRGDENWNTLNNAIKQEEVRLGYKLNDDDKARLVTQMISGYGDNNISIGGTRFSKNRKIEILTPEFNQYYRNSTDSLLDYIRSINSMIEGRNFLGRESKEVTDIRSKIKRAKSRIVEVNKTDSVEVKSRKLGQLFGILTGLENDLRRSKDISSIVAINNRVDSLKNFIDIVRVQRPSTVKKKVLDDVNKKLEELEDEILFSNTNIENGIGAYINSLIEDDIISQDQVEEVTNILRARMNNKGITNKGVILLRDIAYFTTLNDFTNGITQLGDIVLSVYKNNMMNSMLAVGDILSGKANISRKDIGIGDVIAVEYDQVKNRDKARDFIFKWTLISPIDKIGKTVFLQSSWRKLQTKVKNSDKKTLDLINRIFGDKSQQVLEDIKNGNLTFDVKFLLFNSLSEVQPITLSEVPENYLKAGNLKIVYVLKTFAIKAMDIARNESYNEIKKGNVKEGVSNLFKLSVAFAMMGASIGAIKDLILGRDFDLEEEAIDGLLQLVMFNRYIGYKGKRDGYLKAWMNSQLPPTYKLPDDFIKDIESGKEIPKWKSIRNIPLVGEPYYWWFGGGIEAKERDKKDNLRGSTQRKRRSSGRKRR